MRRPEKQGVGQENEMSRKWGVVLQSCSSIALPVPSDRFIFQYSDRLALCRTLTPYLDNIS